MVSFLSFSLAINLLNLLSCLTLTLINLDSPTFFMKLFHFFIVVDPTNDENLDLHLPTLIVLSQRMPLTLITLS